MVRIKTFLTLFTMVVALIGCSDAKEKKVEIKRTSTGYVALGRVANSSIEIYSLDNGYDTPVCRAQSNFDSQVLDRVGWVSIPRDCYTAGEQLYLVVASGGTDLDADNDGVLDTSGTPVSGTLHVLLRGDDFVAGNWYINPATELIYQYLKGALAAGIPEDSLLSQANKLASQIIGDTNSDSVQDYTDVVTWNPQNTALFYRSQLALSDISQAIRDNDDTEISNQTAILLNPLVGSFETLGAGYTGGKGLAIQDNIVYLADGNRGLSVIDVSNPGSPELISVFDPKESQQAETYANVSRVKVSGNLAAVCLGAAGVALLDISDPANISEHSILDAEPCTGEIIIANGHLFLESDLEVIVYNLSDPDNSVEVDRLGDYFSTDIIGMGVYDNVLYVLWYATGNGVFSFDITDPGAITAIDDSPDSNDIFASYYHYRFSVSENYLIHHANYPGDLLGYKIYNIDTGITSNITTTGSHAENSATLLNNIFYLADGSSGLRRVDVRDGVKISRKPNIDILSSTSFTNAAYDLVTAGDYLYVATEFGLEIYNFSSDRSSQMIASLAVEDYPYDISMNSTTLAVPSFGGLEVFDLSTLPDINPSSTINGISQSRSVALFDDASYALNNSPWRITVFNNVMDSATDFAQLTDNVFGLNYTDSDSPPSAGEYHIFERWGDHLTVATNAGFFDIDISNPLVPSVSRAITSNNVIATTYCSTYAINCTIGTHPGASDVAIYNDIVYAEISGNIYTLDLSNQLSFSFSSIGIGNSNALDADELYIYSATDSDIEIYDRDTFNSVTTIAIDSGIKVVVSDYPRLFALHRDKLTVYDISVFPAQVTETFATDYASNVVVSGNYAFIIDGYSGMYAVALKTIDVP